MPETHFGLGFGPAIWTIEALATASVLVFCRCQTPADTTLIEKLRIGFDLLRTTDSFTSSDVGRRNPKCFLICDQRMHPGLIDKQASGRIDRREKPFKCLYCLFELNGSRRGFDRFLLSVFCINPTLDANRTAKGTLVGGGDEVLSALLAGLVGEGFEATLVCIEPMLIVGRLEKLLAELARSLL